VATGGACAEVALAARFEAIPAARAESQNSPMPTATEIATDTKIASLCPTRRTPGSDRSDLLTSRTCHRSTCISQAKPQYLLFSLAVPAICQTATGRELLLVAENFSGPAIRSLLDKS
jgi:hypothetical protein